MNCPNNRHYIKYLCSIAVPRKQYCSGRLEVGPNSGRKKDRPLSKYKIWIIMPIQFSLQFTHPDFYLYSHRPDFLSSAFRSFWIFVHPDFFPSGFFVVMILSYLEKIFRIMSFPISKFRILVWPPWVKVNSTTCLKSLRFFRFSKSHIWYAKSIVPKFGGYPALSAEIRVN